MKFSLLTALFFLLASSLFAQKASSENISNTPRLTLTGAVMDSTTGKSIPGATVQLRFDPSNSGATAASHSKVVVANTDGNFVLQNIPKADKYTLVISAVGYESATKELFVAFPANAGKGVVKNIGTVRLLNKTKLLGNVVVTATVAPAMQFGIDRKIFNVEKNITAQGGTAVDVMKNIPSVSVDVDGNVQMRNSTPQILIDGRPTILTLDQIPADDIEKVELITNPSAKYDASSSGGIINIVLKKNKRVGLNGIASLGGGVPGLYNGNLSLNLREKNFNLFASGSYNRSGGTANEETFRENKNNDTITDYFKQTTANERIRKFHSIRFGMDYFLDKNNTLSFTQGFHRGNFGSDETQQQQFLDQSDILSYNGLRTSEGTGIFDHSSSRVSFERKTGDQPDDKLTADITYNKGTRSDYSDIVNNFYYPDGTLYSPETRVRNSGLGKDYEWIGQIDYSNKFNDNKRIELGLRTFYNKSSTNFGTYSVDQENNEVKLPLSNNYNFTEAVNAGYFNYANKWKSITYQAGLRVELAKFDGLLVDSNFHFGYQFPDGLKNLGYSIFPSIFFTKPLSDNEDLQLNYSKRIRRPRFWEVNPFVDINDPLNIRQGNPALRPEYTNSFELNYFNRFPENGGSFLAVLYFKNNIGDITEYSDTISPALFARLNNAAVSPDAILNTFINAGHTNRMGAEFTLQKKVWQNLDLNYNIDLQYRTTKASVNNISLDNRGFNFETKLIANYKIVGDKSPLFNNLGFQLIADYEGPSVIPQGRMKSQFVSDFAMRKEFLKNRAASLSFSVNDIFNSRKFGTIYDTENFYQDSYRRWSVRTFRLTFSYKFGDSDFDLFKKKSGNTSGGYDEGGVDTD